MSQKQIILNHLNRHGSITSAQAISRYWITRLAAIIGFLKEDGIPIKSDRIRVKKKSVAKYWIPPANGSKVWRIKE